MAKAITQIICSACNKVHPLPEEENLDEPLLGSEQNVVYSRYSGSFVVYCECGCTTSISYY